MPKRLREHKEKLIEDIRMDRGFAVQYLISALEESEEMFLQALRHVAEAYDIVPESDQT